MKYSDITELDLYTYVCFQEQLDAEKLLFIETNKHSFTREIEYFATISGTSSPEDRTGIEKKALELFPDVPVSLFKVKIENKYINDSTKFAAKSNSNSSWSACSFLDKNNRLLLKFVPTGESYQLFLFSEKGEEIKRYIVKGDDFGLEIGESNTITIEEYSKLVEGEELTVMMR